MPKLPLINTWDELAKAERSRKLGKADDWLTANIVDPMANAGYPNVGAALATIPSAWLDMTTPEHGYDYSVGVAKLGRMAEGEATRYLKKAGSIPRVAHTLYNDAQNEMSGILNKLGVPDKVESKIKKHFADGKSRGSLIKNPLFQDLEKSLTEKYTPKEVFSLQNDLDSAGVEVNKQYSKRYKVSSSLEKLDYINKKIQEIMNINVGRDKMPDYAIEKLKKFNESKKEVSEELLKYLRGD